MIRAFICYTSRVHDPKIILIVALEREVESEFDTITDRIFTEIEEELASAYRDGELDGPEDTQKIQFEYDTRLLLPAMLTHGHLHTMANDIPLLRYVDSVDEDLLSRSEETTVEITRALLDGDMRDAINDEEYGDFETSVRPRSIVAEIAQRCLQSKVEEWFDRSDTPIDVGRHYNHAVELSEGHQDQDREYRMLLDEYHSTQNEERIAVTNEIRERYKFAKPIESPKIFESIDKLPYFGTQYERVGIIYEDMINMYEADLDLEFCEDFKRSIVLMVIAAQIGLDDTDDYPEDRGSQLTPVTAELNINDPKEGLSNLRELVGDYLDQAEAYSTNHLTGMAIEYIRQQALDRLDDLAAQIPDTDVSELTRPR